MRTIILTALLVATAGPVIAQVPQDARADERRGGERRDDGRVNEGRSNEARGNEARGDQRPDDRGQFDQRRDRSDDQGRDRRFDRQDERRDYRQDGQRDYRQDQRRDDRRDERRDYRDDRRGYGDNDRYARFQDNRFYYPRGYGYRYYGVGTLLPRVFFDQRYYIAQPDYYQLPPAYRGTHWVRVGPDALMVRNYDGRVVRIIRGLFY